MLKRYLMGAFLICSLIGFVLLQASVVNGQKTVMPNREITAQTMPGTGQTIKMARAPWDTGWFQAEVFKQLFESLGYRVDGPRTRDAADFYEAVIEGKMDLWVNGWFPGHESYISSGSDQIEIVGFEVKGGALQGYLVDKKTADALSITSLADFTKPAVVKAFDSDGNGKAELIGCDANWLCAEIIEHHLEVYGLSDTVEQIQGNYSPLMAETVTNYKAGQPIFFYTWTPNWTVGVLNPGQDVIWLGVPFPSLPDEQSIFEDQTIVEGIRGCVSDPCPLGFAPSDIRAVGNKAFLDANPSVHSLLASVSIPLADISAQNALMFRGEDDNDDIRHQAEVWIENHQALVDQWLEDAIAAHTASGLSSSETTAPTSSSSEAQADFPILRVVTKTFEPFVIYEAKTNQYTGFSIELWEELATELGVKYDIYGVNSIAKLLDEVERGAADIATGGIGITSQREQYLNFSQPFFESGLQIMIADKNGGSLWSNSLMPFISAIFSPQLLNALGFLLLALLISAHIIWFSEKKHNPDFPKSYFRGIWESFWWSAVTVTTVGYGDKTPTTIIGRLFGLFWMFAGFFILAYFTAGVATTFALQEVQGHITGPEDLRGKQVATIKKSTAEEYLTWQGISAKTYDLEQDAYNALIAGEVDAIVYDAPALQYYALHEGQGLVKMAGVVFQKQNYGLALHAESPYTEQINLALLRLIERGDYQELYQKWFGEEFAGD